MADTKKIEPMEELDFMDLTGETEQVVVVPKEEVFPVGDIPRDMTTDTSIQQATAFKNVYHIPVPTDTGWKLVDIVDISGEDFLRWAEAVYPAFASRKINPEVFEGPRKLLDRKQIVNDIAEWGKAAQLRGRKVDTEKILQ